MLHVLDGDATLPDFQRARLPGESVVWREALLEGPWPRALRGVDDCLRATREAMQKDDEIVLWFDADLFCRLHAAYFAAYFTGARLTNALGGHADRGRLSQHWEKRFAVDPAIAEVWHAYASPDPRGLVPLVARFPWVRLHLARFPSGEDGLNAIERRVVALLREEGPLPFARLFRAVATDELAPTSYGLTDVELDRTLRELAPLVAPAPGPGPDVVWGLADVDARRDVPRERWLGGARAREWRWDGTALRRAP